MTLSPLETGPNTKVMAAPKTKLFPIEEEEEEEEQGNFALNKIPI
jgi:hypothetical protein